MGVSKNRGTPKSWILIGFSIINHPLWGIPVFGNTQIGLQELPIWIGAGFSAGKFGKLCGGTGWRVWRWKNSLDLRIHSLLLQGFVMNAPNVPSQTSTKKTQTWKRKQNHVIPIFWSPNHVCIFQPLSEIRLTSSHPSQQNFQKSNSEVSDRLQKAAHVVHVHVDTHRSQILQFDGFSPAKGAQVRGLSSHHQFSFSSGRLLVLGEDLKFWMRKNSSKIKNTNTDFFLWHVSSNGYLHGLLS